MSTAEKDGLIQPNSDNWKKVREILLPSVDLHLTRSNNVHVDTLVDTLFQEHFGTLFAYYDETAFCNRRSIGAIEPARILHTHEDLWIFGYGSLVWKADFPFIDKKQGYIEGFRRRFFQHSIDHRGTTDKPGRVVTLIPSHDTSGRVYGVAYRIAKEQKDEVLAHLDYREKNGYERCTVKFTEFDVENSFDIIMYIATNDNKSFGGGDEDNLEPIADQIYTSAGPSGPNREYLFFLADAMRELFPGVQDDHLFELERLVRKREQRDDALKHLIKGEIHRILMKESMDEVIIEFKTLIDNCGRDEYLDDWFKKLKSDSRLVN